MLNLDDASTFKRTVCAKYGSDLNISVNPNWFLYEKNSHLLMCRNAKVRKSFLYLEH